MPGTSVLIPDYPLKIVTGAAMAEIDRVSIEERGLSGGVLMERAGRGTAEHMLETFPPALLHRAMVFCGKGNNGGDGFVIARYLAQRGHFPVVTLTGRVDDLKGDARANRERLGAMGVPVHEWSTPSELESILPRGNGFVIVDALLGTGSKGAPRGAAAAAVQWINERAGRNPVVSVDIPSGADAGTGAVDGGAVRADRVYTMGLPKTGHTLPPGMDYCKSLIVLDIGFPRDLMDQAPSEAELLTARRIDSWLPRRSPSAHKGSEGHLLIVAGSRGMTGAALICAMAAVRAGAGLVTAACPESLLPVFANSVWEKLTLPVRETPEGTFAEEAFGQLFGGGRRYSAAVIGPGLSLNPSTANFVRRAVRETDLPLVLDGDALTAAGREAIAERRAPWIAAPHPGEMARLFGVDARTVQGARREYARGFADNPNGAAILKGSRSVIACAGEPLWVNPAGNAAMASGGMGDALAGIAGAYLARGMEPARAACAAAYIHGLAGDLWAEEGYETLGASQLIERIQPAVREMRRRAGDPAFQGNQKRHTHKTWFF